MFKALDLPKAQIDILEASYELLNTEGYKSLTVRKICQKADCALGTFYHYFKGRDDIVSFFIACEYKNYIEKNAAILNEESPVEQILDVLTYIAKYFSSLGIGVLEEFFSPRNKALNVSSLSKFDQRYFFVADLKERITNAIENSIKNKFDKKNDNLSYEIYTGFESIFYGTVFNWAINNGSFDIEETIKKYLKIYLSYYFEE